MLPICRPYLKWWHHVYIARIRMSIDINRKLDFKNMLSFRAEGSKSTYILPI
jgi:hypothetical protein